jgi:hypothetical protein
MQTKMRISKSLTSESDHAIDFLVKISELLRIQRRHFDDAVVTHCIRLIKDYVEDNVREIPAEHPFGVADASRHP